MIMIIHIFLNVLLDHEDWVLPNWSFGKYFEE